MTLEDTNLPNGAIAEGVDPRMIGGNAKDGGYWNGTFHSELHHLIDSYPDSVTCAFDADFSDVGRMVDSS